MRQKIFTTHVTAAVQAVITEHFAAEEIPFSLDDIKRLLPWVEEDKEEGYWYVSNAKITSRISSALSYLTSKGAILRVDGGYRSYKYMTSLDMIDIYKPKLCIKLGLRKNRKSKREKSHENV